MKELQVLIQVPISLCGKLSPQGMAVYCVLSCLSESKIPIEDACLMIENYYGEATYNSAIKELEEHGYATIEE